MRAVVRESVLVLAREKRACVGNGDSMSMGACACVVSSLLLFFIVGFLESDRV